jgi:hypothetical protein
MGCDWISGDCLAVGYGIDYESLFVARDVDNDDTIGYEEAYDEDESDYDDEKGADEAGAETEDKKDNEDDAEGDCEHEVKDNPSPLSVVTSSWKGFLVKNGYQQILDMKIAPHIGFTSMPGLYEKQRYKKYAMVVFGTTIKQGDLPAADGEDDIVAVPAIAFPKILRTVVNEFVKEFVTPRSGSGSEPPPKKKRYFEPTYKSTATLMTVVFVE